MLFAFFETLGRWVQPWADLYSKHANLSTAVLTVHVLSMFVGGGMAIAKCRPTDYRFVNVAAQRMC